MLVANCRWLGEIGKAKGLSERKYLGSDTGSGLSKGLSHVFEGTSSEEPAVKQGHTVFDELVEGIKVGHLEQDSFDVQVHELGSVDKFAEDSQRKVSHMVSDQLHLGLGKKLVILDFLGGN